MNSQFTENGSTTIENRARIELNFQKIFEQRLNEKFLKRFGCEYDAEKREEYSGEQKDACDQNDAIWQSFKTRHLSKLDPNDLQASLDFYPRSLLGMFAIDQFEEAVKTLEGKGFAVIRHPKTEVTSCSKAANGQMILNFSNEQLEADHVVITTGGWKNVATWQSNRYLHNIWPISDLKKDVGRIIKDELQERAEKNDPNKEITIAIEGKGLSAIDVAKTLLQEGTLTTNQDGSFTFSPDLEDEHTIKLKMISRTPLIHKVIEKPGWKQSDVFKQPDGTFQYPEGMLTEKDSFQNIATTQGGKIRLWQIAAVVTRAIEIGYKAAENHAHETSDAAGESNAQMRGEIAREFLHNILSNFKKDDAGDAILSDQEEFKKFMDSLSGNSQSQLKDIEKHFHLQPDGANYSAIFTRFNEMAGFSTDNDPWQQMRKDLHDAEQGDVGGFAVWRQFIFIPPFASFLTTEESSYYYNFLARNLEVLIGMPPITAKELLAFHEAGAVDLVTMGKDVQRSYLNLQGEKVTSAARIKNIEEMQNDGRTEEEIISSIKDHKIVFENNNGETVLCDIAINAAHKYGLGFKQSLLLKSLKEQGIIKMVATNIPYCDNDIEYEQKKLEMISSFGADESELILKAFTKDADGKWHCKRWNMPMKDGIPLDENGNSTAENLLILSGGGGVSGSVELGKKTAISNFTRVTNPQTSTAVTSTLALQASQVAGQQH